MATYHRKVKSVAKVMVPSGERLDGLILDTMKIIADLVGSTLGPGGKVVGIERQEFGIPDLVTKDGVTVFRNMGFDDPVRHSIMTLARDASVRTATEAGDGTTTATVLAEAFVRLTHKYCKNNPKASPQRVVRSLEKLFKADIEPFIKSLAMKPDNKILRAVALCSTNGDTDLTEAVAKCFELTGDEGNVTITESSGPSGYKVEALKGYPVNIGYEDCTGKFFSIFVNDQANNRVYLEKPVFILYHGTVTEFGTLVPLLMKIGERWGGITKNNGPHNVVVVATGFADQVIGDLAAPWAAPEALNIYPLVVPKNAMQSGQLDFLLDLAAVTGSIVFDPLTRPVQQGSLEDLGPALDYFEATRYRSNIVGHADEGLVLARLEEVDVQLPQAESIVETNILNERKGKLSGGIAKLIISAPTNGELREKRDRAEDAVCAWRGAVKHGALPGGCWALMETCDKLLLKANKEIPEPIGLIRPKVTLSFEHGVILDIMIPALGSPFGKLLGNCGYTDDEGWDIQTNRRALQSEANEPAIFDALEGVCKLAKDSGVFDSLPAVLEAVRNSISIAAQLGTLGGVIVFPRDPALERQEASDSYDFYRNAGMTQND